jgi:hypothetical protein
MANAITSDLQRLVIEPGRAQDSKKWQSPSLGGRRQFDDYCNRNLFQADAFGGVFFTRSDRVAVAAQLFDHFPAPAFDCIVAGKDDGLLQHGGKDQMISPGKIRAAPTALHFARLSARW